MPHTKISNFKFQISNCHLKGGAGFTLIELLVTITILGIISAIGLTTYSNAQIAGRDARREQDLKAVQTALEIYYQAQAVHAYPTATLPAVTNWATLVSKLDTNYINQMPTPPVTGDYTYSGTATTYSLCSKLENKSANNGNGIETCDTNCGGAATNKCFHLTNP